MTIAVADARDKKKRAFNWRSVAVHGCLIFGALLMIYPLLWLASSSLKPANLIFSDLSLWPSKIRLQNYVDGWRGAALPFSTFFMNSFIVSGLAVVGNVLACSMVAYAFARLNFIFKKTLFAVMMLTIMLPLHATLIPQYALFHKLGWVNTFLPLTVPKFLAVDAFFIFLMIQFIRGIPRELDEAATIDGAGPIRLFTSIVLPYLRPLLIILTTLSVIWDFGVFNQIWFMRNGHPEPGYQTLGIYMYSNGIGSSHYNLGATVAVLMMAGLLTVMVFYVRQLIRAGEAQ